METFAYAVVFSGIALLALIGGGGGGDPTKINHEKLQALVMTVVPLFVLGGIVLILCVFVGIGFDLGGLLLR